MASPEAMKKDELISEYRKLTQELKRLLAENDELKKKSDNTVSSVDSLSFDSVALSVQANENKEFEVHLLDYDSKSGQGIVKSKTSFKYIHLAEFEAKKQLHETIFKGVK